MLLRTFVVLLLITTIPGQVRAFNNDSIATRIFTLIYDQNLDEAELVLRSEKNQLNDFYYTFLNLDLHWWKYRTTGTKENTKKLDTLIAELVDPDTNTAEKKIKQLIVKSYQLRFEKKQFNLIGLITARSEIKELIKEIETENPTIEGDEQKLFESYLTMYQYIENINFLFNNHRKSAERLKKLTKMERFATEENVMVNTIAHFFLARMYQKIEREPKVGLDHFNYLLVRFPTNKTFLEYQEECEQKI